MPPKRLSITSIKVNIRPGALIATLLKAYEAATVKKQWAESSWAKGIGKHAAKAKLSDFDRFKVMVARKYGEFMLYLLTIVFYIVVDITVRISIGRVRLRMHSVVFASWLACWFPHLIAAGIPFSSFFTPPLKSCPPSPETSIPQTSHRPHPPPPAPPAARPRRQRPPQEEPQEEVGAAYSPLLAGGASALPALAGREVITAVGSARADLGPAGPPPHLPSLLKTGASLVPTDAAGEATAFTGPRRRRRALAGTAQGRSVLQATGGRGRGASCDGGTGPRS
jgi:hypothetical protein